MSQRGFVYISEAQISPFPIEPQRLPRSVLPPPPSRKPPFSVKVPGPLKGDPDFSNSRTPFRSDKYLLKKPESSHRIFASRPLSYE